MNETDTDVEGMVADMQIALWPWSDASLRRQARIRLLEREAFGEVRSHE